MIEKNQLLSPYSGPSVAFLKVLIPKSHKNKTICLQTHPQHSSLYEISKKWGFCFGHILALDLFWTVFWYRRAKRKTDRLSLVLIKIGLNGKKTNLSVDIWVPKTHFQNEHLCGLNYNGWSCDSIFYFVSRLEGLIFVKDL